MTPIFERAGNVFAGAWASDSVLVSLSGGIPSMLLQNISASYQQATRTLYALNTPGNVNLMYLLGGRASGQAQVQRMIGEADLMRLFYKKFGNICNVGTNHLSIITDTTRCDLNPSGVGPNNNLASYGYEIMNAHIAGVAVNIAVDPILVQESTSLNFANLMVPD